MSQNELRKAHDAPVLPARKARQAAPLGHVRYVLAISLGAAVLAGAVIWFAFFA